MTHNWLLNLSKGEPHYINQVLTPLLDQTNILYFYFYFYTCQHIYTESSETINALSNKGLLLDYEEWHIKQHVDGEYFESLSKAGLLLD